MSELESIWIDAYHRAVELIATLESESESGINTDVASRLADIAVAHVQYRRDIGWEKHAKDTIEKIKAAQVERGLVNGPDRLFFDDDDDELFAVSGGFTTQKRPR